MSIASHITSIRATIPSSVTLVCVSKFHPAEAIMEAYTCGERDFGESRVQELMIKFQTLPKDIRWHFIGHLQTNKVKQIVPFVHMIHSVDSVHLLETINREAEKIQRRVKVLLEVHVAKEETKSGFTSEEILSIANSPISYSPSPIAYSSARNNQLGNNPAAIAATDLPMAASVMASDYGTSLFGNQAIDAYNGTYNGARRSGIAGRQNSIGFGDTWWNWLDAWIKDHGEEMGVGEQGEDGYYGGYELDRYDLQAAYDDFIAIDMGVG